MIITVTIWLLRYSSLIWSIEKRQSSFKSWMFFNSVNFMFFGNIKMRITLLKKKRKLYEVFEYINTDIGRFVFRTIRVKQDRYYRFAYIFNSTVLGWCRQIDRHLNPKTHILWTFEFRVSAWKDCSDSILWNFEKFWSLLLLVCDYILVVLFRVAQRVTDELRLSCM